MRPIIKYGLLATGVSTLLGAAKRGRRAHADHDEALFNTLRATGTPMTLGALQQELSHLTDIELDEAGARLLQTGAAVVTRVRGEPALMWKMGHDYVPFDTPPARRQTTSRRTKPLPYMTALGYNLGKFLLKQNRPMTQADLQAAFPQATVTALDEAVALLSVHQRAGWALSDGELVVYGSEPLRKMGLWSL